MHMLGARRSEAYAGTHHSTMKMCLQLCAEGQKDLPARGHREDVSGMAFSHRLHDRAAQQLGRSAWLRQRFHARNVYSRSAPTGWRELCRHTATRYWPKACVRSTRATPPHALAITLACPRSSAWPLRWSGIRLVTQTMKPAVRGARGTCLRTTCRSPSMCSPQRPQRPPPWLYGCSSPRERCSSPRGAAMK